MMTLSPPWSAVASLVEQNTRDLIAGRFSLGTEVASWFKSLALFRAAEAERLIDHDPTREDLRWHRALLSTLLADGERLLLDWENSAAASPTADRIAHEDLEAAVRGLYATQSMWHGDLTIEQRKAIIREVFQVNPDDLRFDVVPAGSA
jgi:hypothetical protein